jgi:cysteine synthase A
MKANKITDLIGNTPLVKLNKVNQSSATVYAKLESFNPMSSIKDRIALAMIEDAEKEGKLQEGSVIIEPTSGNTGIGLAYIAAVKGYRIILTMPDTMSSERGKLLQALGAEVALTDGKAGMKGAIEKAEYLAETIPQSFVPGQFSNPENPKIHYAATGPEIWRDCPEIGIFVAGVGTGGTVSGAGMYLRERNPEIRIIAVEPEESPVLSGGSPRVHRIQGIGAGFIPRTLDTEIYDEVTAVSSRNAYSAASVLAKTEGLLCGPSSGAALFAAECMAKRRENEGKKIVVVLADKGERYLSEGL